MEVALRWLIRSALDDLMPSGGPVKGALEVGWDAFAERYQREASPLMWGGLVAGSVVYAASPVITLGIPLPAFALPTRLRDLHAERVMTHDVYLVRQAVFLLKLNAGFAWGADPEVRRSVHLGPLPPDPTDWRKE